MRRKVSAAWLTCLSYPPGRKASHWPCIDRLTTVPDHNRNGRQPTGMDTKIFQCQVSDGGRQRARTLQAEGQGFESPKLHQGNRAAGMAQVVEVDASRPADRERLAPLPVEGAAPALPTASPSWPRQPATRWPLPRACSGWCTAEKITPSRAAPVMIQVVPRLGLSFNDPYADHAHDHGLCGRDCKLALRRPL